MFTGKGVGSWVSCLCDSEESVMTSKELDEVKVNWGHLTLILLPQLWGARRAERRSNLGEGMYYPNWRKVWEFEWDVEEQEKKKWSWDLDSELAFHAATVVMYKVRFFYCPSVFLFLGTEFHVIAGKINIPTCVHEKLWKTKSTLQYHALDVQ